MAEPVYVTRTAAFLPHAPVDNEGMERVLGTPGQRRSRVRRVVLRQNGIVSRHYVVDPVTGIPSFNNAQLTAEAVRRLCADGFALGDLRCLVAGTSLPDQLVPNHAVMVHGEIGGPSCEVVATAGVCLAGLSALKYAWLAVRAGEHANAIATGSEIASLVFDGTSERARHECDLLSRLRAHVEPFEERPRHVVREHLRVEKIDRGNDSTLSAKAFVQGGRHPRFIVRPCGWLDGQGCVPVRKWRTAFTFSASCDQP